jgi:hypothetical protein
MNAAMFYIEVPVAISLSHSHTADPEYTLNPDPHPDPGLAVSKFGSGSKVLIRIQAWFCETKNFANTQPKILHQRTLFTILFFFSL